MHCNDQAHFHRVSVENINPGSLNSVNIVANNGGGANEARVPWREKRGDSGRAWMFLNLQDDNTEVGLRIFHVIEFALSFIDHNNSITLIGTISSNRYNFFILDFIIHLWSIAGRKEHETQFIVTAGPAYNRLQVSRLI